LASILLTIFFLLLLPPPHYTLFPYTTLFRSQSMPCRFWNQIVKKFLSQVARLNTASIGCKISLGANGEPAGPIVPLMFPNFRGQDRKSTRLNSSHLVISYAVFCLKKKI